MTDRSLTFFLIAAVFWTAAYWTAVWAALRHVHGKLTAQADRRAGWAVGLLLLGALDAFVRATLAEPGAASQLLSLVKGH